MDTSQVGKGAQDKDKEMHWATSNNGPESSLSFYLFLILILSPSDA